MDKCVAEMHVFLSKIILYMDISTLQDILTKHRPLRQEETVWRAKRPITVGFGFLCNFCVLFLFVTWWTLSKGSDDSEQTN